MKDNSFFSAKRITYIAILFALVIALQALGGTLTIGAVQLNFTLIPIVVGAILLGPTSGLVLGLACGVVVLIQVIMGLSPFYTIIWTEAPVITTMICIFKTTVAGFVAGIVFKAIKRKNVHVAVFVASAIVPIINTLLFIVGCLCMNGAITSFQTSLLGAMPEVAGMNIFIFIIVVLVTFNFFVELAINLLVSPALYRVIKIFDKEISSKEGE